MREIRLSISRRGTEKSRIPYPYRDSIFPVRNTVVALPRNEMEDHAPFACDDGAATDAGVGF
jgi:hypothetical protein